MKTKIDDADKAHIARALRAERRGAVRSGPGHFGALQLAADVAARFRTPETGGRGTDPTWTEKRLVSLAPATLQRLERVAKDISAQGHTVAPLQVAALLLERAVAEIDERGVAELARARTG